MIKENMVQLLASSLNSFRDRPAFSNYREKGLTYGEAADRILYLHRVFRNMGLKRGDKVAVLGKNSVNWAVTYLATITYGAVIVPVLPDFKPDDTHHIINHSDSVLLFAADSLYEGLDDSSMPKVEAIFSLSDFSPLYYRSKGHAEAVDMATLDHEAPEGGQTSADTFKFEEISNDELAAIVYTSGTTGFTKGVMLPHNSLAANVVFARTHIRLEPGDSILSFLPIAHVFGCAFEFLFPFTCGCHITFLTKTPSPRVIIKAFQEIHPRVIFSVPLIIEKIYKTRIAPALEKGSTRLLMKMPFMRRVLYGRINQKLSEVFGANFSEIIIGGAALNPEVEGFLRAIKFPFTVGYGMTECGPLISYAGWKDFKVRSTGRLIDTLEIKIDSEDPGNDVGEIMVRGENVMRGYYRDDEASRKALDRDGWLHTGDLGVVDEEDFIFIKGRNKSMILGSSGKNIFPEELEAKLDNMPLVQESIVVERDGRLVALVYPDLERVDAEGITEPQLNERMEENRKAINRLFPDFMAIARIEVFPEEFEKTPKKSIKRFLYTAG